MAPAEKEATSIEPWAAGIGLGILAVVGCVAAFTAWDRAETGRLERVTEPTAVGDTAFVKEPPGGTGPLGLTLEGRTLEMVKEAKVRDGKLIREGKDDSGRYSIYRGEDEKAGIEKGQLYMKTAPNEFIEVK